MRLFGGLVSVLIVVAAAYAGWAMSRDGVLVMEKRVEITRPVTEVFPYLVDAKRLDKWRSDRIASRPVGEPGIYVGSKSIETLDVNGTPEEMKRVIVGFEENKKLAIETTGSLFVSADDYRVSEHDGMTEIEYRSETRLTMPWLRLLAPVLRQQIRRKVDADFAKLEAIVEHEVAAGP